MGLNLPQKLILLVKSNPHKKINRAACLLISTKRREADARKKMKILRIKLSFRIKLRAQ